MHKWSVIAVSVLLAATSTSSAWAKWGCGAAGPRGAWADNWAEPSEAEARADILKNYGKDLPIIACKDDIDTMDQADALWKPAEGKVTKCNGSGVDSNGGCK